MDLSDNFIQEDVSVPGTVVNERRIGAAPPPRVPCDDPSLHLTAAMTVEAKDTVLSLAEIALEVGRAHIREGCYCCLGKGGKEIVKIGQLHKECEVLIEQDMQATSTLVYVSDHQVLELELKPGVCLVVGHEMLRFRSFRGRHADGQLLLVVRALCGTKAEHHPRNSKMRRLAYVEVERGTCMTESMPHDIGAKLVRVSQIGFLAKAVLRNTSLVELKMEHNQIEQAGGEVLQPAVKRLECFTVSHKFMSKELFGELYKDGTGKKGKKGKKKK